MPDWKVVVYGVQSTDEDDEYLETSNCVIASWHIEDRTENEAFREAVADVQVLGAKVADWTMTEV